MTPREHALAQPEGRAREKPGEVGEGDWYRIVVRDKNEFTTFRYHDLGEKGGDVQRLAGKRSSGSWDTQAWLINKKSAHIENEEEELIPDTDDAREVIEALGSVPKHVKGDIFEAKDRPNIPEKEKPTEAQQRARSKNIEKAQQARWGTTAHNVRK
jgi:hypothetical protein